MNKLIKMKKLFLLSMIAVLFFSAKNTDAQELKKLNFPGSY